MTAASKKTMKVTAKPYEPSPLESRAVETYRAARKDKLPVPRLKVIEKSGQQTVLPVGASSIRMVV